MLRLVMSISKKPWNSREFGNSRAAFAQHFLTTYSADSLEFLAMCEDIANDLNLPGDTQPEVLHEKCAAFRTMCTETDAARISFLFSVGYQLKPTLSETVAFLCVLSVFAAAKVTLRRWFQWVFRWPQFAQCWHFMLLGCMWLVATRA